MLLILASVSITVVFGDNGLLQLAKEAGEKTNEAKDNDLRQIAMAEAVMNFENTKYKGVTIPAGFAPTRIEGEDSIDDGLVIIDSKGNSYVWIEVPKSIYSNTKYTTDIETPINTENCEGIEKVLQNYTKEYRDEANCSDIWHEGCGIDNKEEYDELKNKMLKSVYENGGFWVGQFEVGYEGDKIRFYDKTWSDLNPTDEMPVIKANAYPYNWVRCSQAQALASNMSAGQCNSSLMFGIQWDLMLKFLEVKGAKTTNELMKNSQNWGNYKEANFIVKQGKYSENKSPSFIDVLGSYQKETMNWVLLTTGATERNSVLNIYDIAGNLWEFTLEKIIINPSTSECCSRGGCYNLLGNDNPDINDGYVGSVFGRNCYHWKTSSHFSGFRTTLF